MKIDIEIGQKFSHDGTFYTCVGHDDCMVWGVTNEFEESKHFDIQNCYPISLFTLKN